MRAKLLKVAAVAVCVAYAAGLLWYNFALTTGLGPAVAYGSLPLGLLAPILVAVAFFRGYVVRLVVAMAVVALSYAAEYATIQTWARHSPLAEFYYEKNIAIQQALSIISAAISVAVLSVLFFVKLAKRRIASWSQKSSFMMKPRRK